MKRKGVVLELPAGSTCCGPDDWHGVLTQSRFQTSSCPPCQPEAERWSDPRREERSAVQPLQQQRQHAESIKAGLFFVSVVEKDLLLRLPEMV